MIKINTKKKYLILLIVGVVLWAACYLFALHLNVSSPNKHLYKTYQKSFLDKEKQVDRLFLSLKEAVSIDNSEELLDFLQQKHYDDPSFYVFVYRDSLLTAWNTNKLRIPQNLQKENIPSVYNFQDQWLYIKHKEVKNTIYFVGFSLEELTNKYKNICPYFTPLDLNSSSDNFIVVNQFHEPLIGLNFQPTDENTLLATLLLFLAITAVIFVNYAIIGLMKFWSIFKNSPKILLIMGGNLLGISFLIPFLWSPLFCPKLFTPIYYSSSSVKSLGILFILSYLLLGFAILFNNLFILKNSVFKQYKKILYTIVAFCGLICFDWFFCTIITSVTHDSILTLLPNMIFQYDILSWVAIISVLFLLWSIFIISKKCINEFYKWIENPKLFLILGIGTTLVMSVILIFSQNIIRQPALLSFFLVFIILFIGLIVFQIFDKRHQLWFYLSGMLIMSFGLFFLLRHPNKERERILEKTLAEQIFLQEDPYINFELQEIVAQIETDSVLYNSVSMDYRSISNIKNYIFNKYFEKKFDKFHIFINLSNLSDTKDSLKMLSLKQKYLSSNFVEAPAILCRQKRLGFTEYVIHQPLQIDSCNYILLIVLQNNAFANIIDNPNNNFALAVYEQGVLKATIGQAQKPFLSSFSDYNQDKFDNNQVHFKKDRIHYSAYAKDNFILLISPVKISQWQNIAFVEIAFVLNFLCLLLALFLSIFLNAKIEHLPMSINLILNSFILSFFVIVVIILMIFFVRFYIMTREEYHEQMLMDNAKEIQRSISLTIEEKNITNLNEPALEQINEMIEKLFDAEFLDLNIYDKFGQVVQSYGKGLTTTSTLIHPSIFHVFKFRNSPFFSKDQAEGNNNFIYSALKDNSNNIIGYIGLLTPKITSFQDIIIKYRYFVSKFIGLGLFIIFAIIVLGFYMVKIITKPLQKVTKNLFKIDVENQNFEKIVWYRNDEIGQLVNSYNILQERLRASAEILEKNAQEMAWKEMAKQIAHEIKNPLTPMRLKTQLLLQNIDNLDKKKLKDYMLMILEQIDILNETASSFSNIAQNSMTNATTENIVTIVQDTILLFEAEQNIKISFINKSNNNKPLSFIDKSQLIRVLVNLIKNAVQAQKTNEILTIDIVLQNYGEHFWQINITDNGKGILPEEKDKIFQPNFTTKTSGSGIGLSVVKNIVFSWGGNISFESIPNEKTTFSFTLPHYYEKN